MFQRGILDMDVYALIVLWTFIGRLWLAVCLVEPCALKVLEVLSREQEERVNAEIDIWCKMQHKHIARLLDWWHATVRRSFQCLFSSLLCVLHKLKSRIASNNPHEERIRIVCVVNELPSCGICQRVSVFVWFTSFTAYAEIECQNLRIYDLTIRVFLSLRCFYKCLTGEHVGKNEKFLQMREL